MSNARRLLLGKNGRAGLGSDYFCQSPVGPPHCHAANCRALRLALATDGKFPDRLEDIRSVPIPIDPVTGKAFEYTREANRAVLYGPPPTGESAHEGNAIRYEITCC